ncbi:MAG: bifunctional glutamate N-acetyltransferase/amino-acid acetyltransferase ArgJ [bacterium]
MKQLKGGITAPKGFKAAGVHCGIKKNEPDLALIYSEAPAVGFGMFTSNKVKAAPVHYSLRKIRRHRAQAIIINSGNANACTGEKGLRDSEKMARLVAHRLGVKEALVLVASTGKIGEPLPMSRIETGIGQLVQSLSFKGGHQAAQAILTTDKITKEIAVETDIPARGKGKVVIGGMAKGAGMISPNLATMLCFITTDACITGDALEEATRSAVNKSFNQISVDGDMSTNDSLFVLANGLSRNERIKTWHKKKKIRVEDENFDHFFQALDFVCGSLAKLIVRDGEGATKFIEIKVKGAPFPKDARRVARAVANSMLVKTAIAGASPNWGRVMSVVGAAHAKVKPDRVDVYFDNFLVVKGGMGIKAGEGKLREILKQDEVKITIDLHQGKAKASFWGCDLTEKYVKINKRYV